MSTEFQLPTWPRWHGEPLASGAIRSQLKDFQVDEILGFAPDGAGEHILVHVEKRGQNTPWVAKQLAQFVGVPARAVTWAGLKDRHAVTRQWFGIHLPGKATPKKAEPDFSQFACDGVNVLQAGRHGKKLRTGALQGNRFSLNVRFDEPLSPDLLGQLEQRCEAIRDLGVPNYYGEQRFGFGGANVTRAERMFRSGRKERDRNKRSIYLSAARSYLFNQSCAARLGSTHWQQLLPGDALMLKGSNSFFTAEPLDEVIRERFATGDVRLSAPLWGRGALPATGEAGEFEQQVFSGELASVLCQGLEQAGMKQERRALLLQPEDLTWQIAEQQLQLSFALPAGCFATSVLRELVDYRDASDKPVNR